MKTIKVDVVTRDNQIQLNSDSPIKKLLDNFLGQFNLKAEYGPRVYSLRGLNFDLNTAKFKPDLVIVNLDTLISDGDISAKEVKKTYKGILAGLSSLKQESEVLRLGYDQYLPALFNVADLKSVLASSPLLAEAKSDAERVVSTTENKSVKKHIAVTDTKSVKHVKHSSEAKSDAENNAADAKSALKHTRHLAEDKSEKDVHDTENKSAKEYTPTSGKNSVKAETSNADIKSEKKNVDKAENNSAAESTASDNKSEKYVAANADAEADILDDLTNFSAMDESNTFPELKDNASAKPEKDSVHTGAENKPEEKNTADTENKSVKKTDTGKADDNSALSTLRRQMDRNNGKGNGGDIANAPAGGDDDDNHPSPNLGGTSDKKKKDDSITDNWNQTNIPNQMKNKDQDMDSEDDMKYLNRMMNGQVPDTTEEDMLDPNSVEDED